MGCMFGANMLLGGGILVIAGVMSFNPLLILAGAAGAWFGYAVLRAALE